MKIKVGVIFGGKSVEHEISVITASQAINAFNSTLKGTANENNRLIHFYNGAPIEINVLPRDLAYQISCNLKDSTARLFDTSSKAKKKEDEILSSEPADE